MNFETHYSLDFVCISRAVGRSENPGGKLIMWLAKSAHLVGIGVTGLPKSGEHDPQPPGSDGPVRKHNFERLS